MATYFPSYKSKNSVSTYMMNVIHIWGIIPVDNSDTSDSECNNPDVQYVVTILQIFWQ